MWKRCRDAFVVEGGVQFALYFEGLKHWPVQLRIPQHAASSMQPACTCQETMLTRNTHRQTPCEVFAVGCADVGMLSVALHMDVKEIFPFNIS